MKRITSHSFLIFVKAKSKILKIIHAQNKQKKCIDGTKK